MTNQIMSYFQYGHLPPHLQTISKPIGDLAMLMDSMIPDGPEKSAGLRKLLEAKDCLVRAALGKELNVEAKPRTILHITVGDPTWEPTMGELQAIQDVFLDAKADPEGSVIATRCGVVCDIIRVAGDTELQVVEVNVDEGKASELVKIVDGE